jgi:hypothetical protein
MATCSSQFASRGVRPLNKGSAGACGFGVTIWTALSLPDLNADEILLVHEGD